MEGESMITLHMEEGQCVDVLGMLSDYIMSMEDRVECYGDGPDMDEDKANLITAIVLYDDIENRLETVKHGGG